MGKKLIKYLGNILMVIALIFVAKRIIYMDLDYRILLNWRSLLHISIASLLYMVLVVFSAYAWYEFIRMITGVRIPYAEIAQVNCKANMYKYIPGNVFQYVGRNELAVKHHLKHLDVALATLLDIVTVVTGIFLFSVLCNSSGFFKWFLNEQGEKYLIYIPVLLVFGILVVFIFIKVLKTKFIDYYKEYRQLISLKNLCIAMRCILFQMLLVAFNCLIYIYILYAILGVKMSGIEILMVSGTYGLAWLVGYITPGAPGGMGVRETVFTLLLSGAFPVNLFLLAMVILRVGGIIGDLLAFLLSSLFFGRKEHKSSASA